jgi:excisionase family DNA binding protein
VRENTEDFAAGLLLSPAPPVPPAATAAGRLLTVREVAERLSLCRATVYRLCECGELPHIRLSNAIRVKEEALEQFLLEHIENVP